MEIWFVIVATLCAAGLIKSILGFLISSSGPKLPPGPLRVPVIGNLIWLYKSFLDIEPILRPLHAKYGPVVALSMGSNTAIFISSRSLAHQALIQNGAIFADRPPAIPTNKIASCNQHSINTAFYGSTWRVLRRNLTAEILHPQRIRSFSHARRWVLGIILDRLKAAEPGTAVKPANHFQYGMFCLLVVMCFGDHMDEHQIKEVEALQRRQLLHNKLFNIINVLPRFGKYLFRGRWKEFLALCQHQKSILLPLIRARSDARCKSLEDWIENDRNADQVVCYVDTLLNLELPEGDGKRKLTEEEMVALCSEFLNGGTDTTSTALQWIMANIVKYPNIQERINSDIKALIGPEAVVVEEDDLQKLPYLKAVILEGLRRHPPGHFVLPHAVTEDTELGGFLIPKKGYVNFMVAEMGRDPAVWDDPMAFRPERFLSNGSEESGGGAEVFDITGTREIKMMPFGAGRRMCPGFALALLHLEYYVANLVWTFEWKTVTGDEVDLTEKPEFTVVMKNPLQSIISPRMK